MDIKSEVQSYSPVDGWKPLVGLFVVIVVTIAVARKLGVQQKVNSTIGAGN